MVRPKLYDDEFHARFLAGTLDRMTAALTDGESQSDFIREAVERELKRRERKAKK